MCLQCPAAATAQIEMVQHLNKAGLGSLELFSMGLKATGTYLSRTLAYTGAEFSLARVDIDPQFQVRRLPRACFAFCKCDGRLADAWRGCPRSRLPC